MVQGSLNLSKLHLSHYYPFRIPKVYFPKMLEDYSIQYKPFRGDATQGMAPHSSVKNSTKGLKVMGFP